jgi:hypothetical protein
MLHKAKCSYYLYLRKHCSTPRLLSLEKARLVKARRKVELVAWSGVFSNHSLNYDRSLTVKLACLDAKLQIVQSFLEILRCTRA